MEKMLQGKIALVTGAARGIGRCIAVKLAEYGADVIVNDLKIDEDAPVLSEIRAQGVRAMALPGDITDCAKVNEMVDKAVAEMGRIDVLVNNAGAYPALGVLDVTEDHFNFVVNVNLKGLFFMTQAVVKKSMIPNNYGRIVNISSCDGKNPGRGVAIYSAAKAGVISLTKSFALELADYDINSNARCCPTTAGRTLCPPFPPAVWANCRRSPSPWPFCATTRSPTSTAKFWTSTAASSWTEPPHFFAATAFPLRPPLFFSFCSCYNKTNIHSEVT